MFKKYKIDTTNLLMTVINLIVLILYVFFNNIILWSYTFLSSIFTSFIISAMPSNGKVDTLLSVINMLLWVGMIIATSFIGGDLKIL